MLSPPEGSYAFGDEAGLRPVRPGADQMAADSHCGFGPKHSVHRLAARVGVSRQSVLIRSPNRRRIDPEAMTAPPRPVPSMNDPEPGHRRTLPNRTGRTPYPLSKRELKKSGARRGATSLSSEGVIRIEPGARPPLGPGAGPPPVDYEAPGAPASYWARRIGSGGRTGRLQG